MSGATIYVHRYELIARAPLNARSRDVRRAGALIRVGDGFADVHPHPELGDAPLDEQLARLARGETTRLTRRSLHFATLALDSLFDGVTVPESHWPAAAGEAPAAFDTIKVKMPGNPLPERGRLRLDFNATLTADEFLRVAESLPKERIDFVEDPCPYDADVWGEIKSKTGIRLALDHEVASENVDVLVVKPAIQTVDPESSARDLVVTSYMDHPLGQLFAAYVAAKEATNPRCGLLTHLLFEPNEFSERLTLDGARLVPVRFGDLLHRLPWTRLQ